MIAKLFKYSISAAVLATMIQVTPTYASPEDSTVTQAQIDATQDQIDDFETKIQQLDDRIIIAMEKSENLNNQIKTQQGKIKETEAQIEKAQKSLDTHKKVYSERLKSIQLEGKTSIATYAEILLSSNNLSEFLNRFTAVSKIIESDTDLLNGLNEKEQALRAAEDQLHNEVNQLNKSQNELASEQKNIEADKQEIAKELAAAKGKLENQQGQLAAQQEAERQAEIARQQAEEQARLAQAQQKASTNNSSTTTSTTNLSNSEAAAKVIAYAKQFLGVPYVWGGSTPSGFDCSGFTSYVFRNSVGINLPRVSRDQQDVGRRVSLNQLQPGDLIFRGDPAHHVGIYIGNGQYIHAPQTGDVVKIAAFNPSKWTNAVRVLQ